MLMQSASESPKAFLSIDDAAGLLYVTPRHVIQLIDSGKLAVNVVGDNQWLVPAAAALAYRAEQLAVAKQYFDAQDDGADTA